MRTNLIDCFEQTVKNNPNKTAVIHNDECISFKDLRHKAKGILQAIPGEVRCKPIAVYLPKTIALIYTNLGITYSGNVFMNLDVKTPLERIKNILERVRPVYLITNDKYYGEINKINSTLLSLSIKVINIERDLDGNADIIDKSDYCYRRNNMTDTDPFCIINTSGSTGTPKGVVLNHRSFFDFLDWATETFGLNGNEIMGSLSPAVFDIYDFELCMVMIHGSTMTILDAGLAAWPARLLEAMIKTHVNFIFWVPSIMVNIANMKLLDKLSLDELQTVWFAGEVFPTKQFVYWYDALPNTRFANLYGPIEITLDCTFFDIKERPDETKPLPIGVPCRNTDILILNDHDEPCSVDEEGELCVRGTSLAMGYYNNPEKTAAAFVQNPLNASYPELIYRTGDVVVRDKGGLIRFIGRKDSLIKHMGYRIELGEIEHVIVNELKLVEYCCAVYRVQEKTIVLYYEKPEEISKIGFKKELAKVFPSYMIPGEYIRMDQLPRNTNGKIDRLSLKKMANEN